jgi:hypothetical protein
MNRFEKAAYGGYFPEGEYDRWLDGGPAYGLDKQKMIDLTRLFAAEAAKRKAILKFYSDMYSTDMYSPDEAIKRISASKDPNDFDEADTLPNYYDLEYPRKPRSGILEHLRLKSPGYITDWGQEGHPMEAVDKALSQASSIKKAAEFGAMMGKVAADTWTASNAGDWLPKGNQVAQQPRWTADNLPRPAPINGVSYTDRENDIYKTRQEMHRKAEAVRAAAGAYGPGTARGVMIQGKVQPGATFEPQRGVQGGQQAAPLTAAQNWKQRVAEHDRAQAARQKGTDKEIQSSSWTSPNAASFLPRSGSNIQNSPAPTNVAPRTSSIMESSTPKRLP